MPELAPAMSETSTGTTPAGSPAIPRAESTETNVEVQADLGAQTKPTAEAFAETGTGTEPA